MRLANTSKVPSDVYARWSQGLRVAVMSVAVLVTLGSCGPSQPSTLPDSTGTPGQSSQAGSTPSPSPTEIAYTTDLSLSASEKEAVQKALTALQRYGELLPELFRDGGSDISPLEEVTADSVWKSAQDLQREFKKTGQYVTGEVIMHSHEIAEVDLDRSDDTQIPFIKTYSCIDISNLNIEGKKVSYRPEVSNGPITVEYIMAEYDGRWKLSETYDKTYECT